MSNMIGLKGWAAGIVGGFGYIPGTILGGLLIGVVESSPFWSSPRSTRTSLPSCS